MYTVDIAVSMENFCYIDSICYKLKYCNRHAPSYYVQLCQPKCQIYEKTEYFEYATTVLKPNLFYLINLFGINNVILQGKVEDKISNEARQRHITEKLRNFGTWNCGTLQHVFLSD